MEAFGFKAFITEARRRVFRVVALYIVGAWIALQASALAFPGLDITDFAIRCVWIGAALVLPVAQFFGWRFRLDALSTSRPPWLKKTACVVAWPVTRLHTEQWQV